MVALRKSSKKKKNVSCFSRLISLASWIFAVLTVVINLADVSTDVFVAVQFYQDGHTVWFALVVTFLLVAHCIYTGVLAELLPDSSEWRDTIGYSLDVPRPLRWMFSIVVAQLVPLLHLIVTSIHEHRNGLYDETSSDDEVDDVPTPTPPSPPTRPVRRRRQMPVSDSAPLLDDDDDDDDDETPALGDTNRQHSSNSVIFSHEGSVTLEDFKSQLPKATIQELEATENSRELQRRLKEAVERHLKKFGLFYVESAVEAAPQAIIQLLAITFLGEASPVQLVSLCCSLFSITSKAFIISQAYDARVMVFKFALAAHDVFSMFYLFSTLLAQETHKDVSFFGLELSWIGYIWLWKMVVVGAMAWCTATGGLVYLFYDDWGNISCRDGFAFIGIYLLGIFLAGPLALVFEAAKLSYANFGLTITEPKSRTEWPGYTMLFNFLERDDMHGTRLRHVVRGVMPPIEQRRDDVPFGDITETIDNPDKLVSLWNLPLITAPPSRGSGTWFGGGGPKVHQVLLLIWIGLCFVVLVLGQLLSLAYPFVNAAFQFRTHNLLQATCFYATSFALLVALICAPRALKYALFNVGIRPVSDGLTIELGQELVTDFYLPPHISALQVYIASVPMEVAGVIGAYLAPGDVGLESLTIAQTAALKRKIKDAGATGFAIVAVDDKPPRDDESSPDDEDGSNAFTKQGALRPPPHATRFSADDADDGKNSISDISSSGLRDDHGPQLVDDIAPFHHAALRE